MAIPPFPSKGLAKLVLGYLAEEQLMTAYDEFLQASPYLDAMYNEYDRIFMTSLKSILAEYRAVKIYVETCKPFILRKKLLQCANLLEMVRFLVSHIDVNQLSTPDVGSETSSDKDSANNLFKISGCDVCNSLKLLSCICKAKQNQHKVSNSLPMIHQGATTSLNSVETTSLADLPGSHIKKRKKSVKVLDKGCPIMKSYGTGVVTSEQSSKQSTGFISNYNECYSNAPTVENSQQPLQSNLDLDIKELRSHTTQPKQNIDELNMAPGKVGNNNSAKDKKGKKPKNSNKKGTTPTSFQDFASGVRGGESQNIIILDSNASENTYVQSSMNIKKYENVIEAPKPQVYLKIESVKNNLPAQNTEAMNSVNNYPYIRIKPVDQKVKILSDVKVDNTYNKMISTVINSTSTPLMKTQSVVINGTPAYKTQLIQTHQQTFTKDEIMAMPTIIVVPKSGEQHIIPHTQPVTSLTATTVTTKVNTPSKVLSPLIIDISSPVSEGEYSEPNFINDTTRKSTDIGLVKTVDAITNYKNSSAPKDVITSLAENSTPQVIPITRKSSSTPRRTSHIRVLDFTTPRRILQEAINEQAPDENHHSPIEIIPPEDLIQPINNVVTKNNIQKSADSSVDIVGNKQQNMTDKRTVPIKASWDSKLRSMIALNNEICDANNSKAQDSNTTNEAKPNVTKKIRKSKNIKNKQVTDDGEVEIIDKPEIIIKKPTIHIKSGNDRSSHATSYINKKESEVNQDQLMEEERINTPETDRAILQNVIGAKLNISELLETPYKQVLYDIQMETPRCLGPDLPGEPMSDFKIMNIPTPRFFDSPKIISATPSYSSRPTDYSSGGSYYKPDDQDFVPSTEFNCVVTATKEEANDEMTKGVSDHNKKSSRPVRKCAKNVSYYNISKIRDFDDKTDAASSCSDSASSQSINTKTEKVNLKVLKDKPALISESKPEKKKSSKKRKSPVTKEKPKTFMKIKPRRVTPIKDSVRMRKKTSQSPSPNLQRKRTTSKERNIHVTPAVTCVPTKSRRKSSTPRKLHCSKTIDSSSVHDSADVKKAPNNRDASSVSAQDSDGDQLALQWSDDGSQEVKVLQDQTNAANDIEDISKIQEYIETTVLNPRVENRVFQNDLIKRGFDEETARIIERDLLDTPPRNDSNTTVLELSTKSAGLTNNTPDKKLDNVNTVTNELEPTKSNEDDDDNEIELSVHECNEETDNFIVFEYNDTKEPPARPLITLKDKFSMEVCIDDDLTVRLRTTPITLLYDFNQNHEEIVCDTKETEDAVNSILGIDKLYTPLKPSIRDQVYDIFDSTLTSLDTPLKDNSPKKVMSEITVSAIVLEEEETEKVQQKRKRHQSDGSDESLKDSKKAKPDAQYLLSSANIQNIDIETVLTKLHGP